MQLTELLPTLRELDRGDKLRAVQFLVSELAREDNLPPESDESYPVWSPYGSYDAASALLEALKENKHG